MGWVPARDGPVFVVGTVSVAHFFSHVYLLAFPPLFPILAREFQVSTTQLGLLVTAIYLPQLFLQLPLGIVVDRVGAKRVLAGGLLLTAASIGAAGLAPTYWALLLLAFLSGIGQSVFHPADYALLDAVTVSRNEGMAFSMHTFGGYVGFAAAPAVIGAIGIAIDWRLALLMVGAIGIGYAVLFAIVTPPVYRRALGDKLDPDTPDLRATLRSMLGYLRQWNLLAVALFYLLSMTAIIGLQNYTNVLGVETFGFDESLANSLLTAHLTATAIGVLLGGPLADRLPYRGVIVGTFLLCAGGVSVAAIGLSNPGVVLPFVVLTIVGLCLGAALPSRDRLANDTGDPDATGARFGFFFTGLSLGAVASPTILGWVIDQASPVAAFVLVALALVLAAAVVVGITLHARRSS